MFSDKCNKEIRGNASSFTPTRLKRKIKHKTHIALSSIKKKSRDYAIDSANKYAGTALGNATAANTIYGETKFNSDRGHGFAAERANHQIDILSGRDAQILGDDNAKNGADRLVDGTFIQSKYCATGSKCIAECFDANGIFRYVAPDGTPMQIEVPKDLYDDAVKAMADRIKKGKVPGVSDPKEASNIVRQGNVTYKQAKSIAKAGNIESLKYDAVNGLITAAYAGGISSLVSLGVSVWNGEPYEIALKKSILIGLQVGGTAFAVSVIAGQLTKAGLTSGMNAVTAPVVNLMGPKLSAFIANSMRESGKQIYGAAAMNSTRKILSSNAVTALASLVVLSAGDTIDIFKGRISAAQFAKNVTNTAGGIGGGIGGAVIGSSIFPGIGTVVGGVLGGLVGQMATKKITDAMIEDDCKKMIGIIEQQFTEIAVDFFLSSAEAESVVKLISDKLNKKKGILKDMFASSDREEFAYNEILEPCVLSVVKQREYIPLPSYEDVIKTTREFFDGDKDWTPLDWGFIVVLFVALCWLFPWWGIILGMVIGLFLVAAMKASFTKDKQETVYGSIFTVAIVSLLLWLLPWWGIILGIVVLCIIGYITECNNKGNSTNKSL